MASTVSGDLDQHFLVNEDRIAEMVGALGLAPTDDVVELGAGAGTVSRRIAPCRSLTLVDLDERLCGRLRERLRRPEGAWSGGSGSPADCPEVSVVCGDALRVLRGRRANKVMSNLPCHLTGAVLELLGELMARHADPRGAGASDTRTGTVAGVPRRSPEVAVVAARLGDVDARAWPGLRIERVCVMGPDDFSPRQPFPSEALRVTPAAVRLP
ncbi:MAG: rRNA adenine N-6-methyltransferase family protein [Coriobacteriales bacterium]|jgi:hypothetical protein